VIQVTAPVMRVALWCSSQQLVIQVTAQFGMWDHTKVEGEPYADRRSRLAERAEVRIGVS
jgi:hypothetical protein